MSSVEVHRRLTTIDAIIPRGTTSRSRWADHPVMWPAPLSLPWRHPDERIRRIQRVHVRAARAGRLGESEDGGRRCLSQ